MCVIEEADGEEEGGQRKGGGRRAGKAVVWRVVLSLECMCVCTWVWG